MNPFSPSEAAPADAARRRFIRLLGGGAVVAATLPLAACSADLPADATQAWRSAAGESDIRRYMLAHGLLAPNPHNRQPWIADLSVPDEIGLVCDGARLLPETDPYGRQVLVGCGAFIELAVMAAHSRGQAVTVELFPAGAPDAGALPAGTRVATLRLGAAGSAAADPLFAQIPRRHTHRGAYANDRALPPTLLAAWTETASRFGLRAEVVVQPQALAPIRQLCREAWEIECLTPRTWLESARLMRIGPGAIAEHRDGISLNAPFPRIAHTLGLFDPLKVPVRGTADFDRVMTHWAASETGSAMLALATRGNGRAAQVDAGRAYVRMHLQATEAGAQLHPLSQALQEFPEMRAPFLAMHRAFGLDPAEHTLQMLARSGYALAPATPSPRRGLDALLQA